MITSIKLKFQWGTVCLYPFEPDPRQPLFILNLVLFDVQGVHVPVPLVPVPKQDIVQCVLLWVA